MSECRIGGRARDANRHEGGTAASHLADWLCLAAAPSFAIMALLTGIIGGEMHLATHGTSPLGGMGAMYVLMSAFHSEPWLRLVASRRGGAHRP